jgi:alkylation response protein AidB-like acyl-CoA dehydrogenase
MDVLELAAQLNLKLGDPRDPTQLFSFKQRVAEDEAEQYPSDALGQLNQFNLARHYVPYALGGELRRFDQLAALLRVVARRDLTVAITHAVSFLGSTSVWLVGDESQKNRLAQAVLSGERVSMALTEEQSGSDMLNMSTVAVAAPGGFDLIGQKWLGNGLSHNRYVMIYARTAAQGGPRGYSLFLLDKANNHGGFKPQPKIATLGVRGADISGIEIHASVKSDALIGAEGAGFEATLKALQLSRTLCGSLSLGALDTGLATVLRFAQERRIYGKTVAELPQCQKLLAESWGELLIVDSLTGVVSRALQAVPAQASVHSAVLKYLVPTLTEQAMQRLAVVYGARYYLRDDHEAGIFQKMLRDNLLIGLFDGSTQVNLYSLSHQLRAVTANDVSTDAPWWIKRTAPLDDFAWNGLSLSSGGQGALFASLPSAIAHLRDWLAGAGGTVIADENTDCINASLNFLSTARDALINDVRHLSPAQLGTGDPLVFELARRYCVLATAAAVLADWQLNRAALANTLGNPAVMALVLQRLTSQLGNGILLPLQCYQAVFTCLLARRDVDGEYGLYGLPPAQSQTNNV